MNTTTLFPGPAWAAVAEAEQLLREADTAARYIESFEGVAVIASARDYLTGELGVHYALAAEDMDWSEFDPDLRWFDGDRQDEAIRLAADRALDAAKALRNRVTEYQRREADSKRWGAVA